MSARLLSFMSLLSSSGTLVCCALPALFVSLGAGAAFVSLTSSLPILITISEYKVWVFSVAGVLTLLNGFWPWRNRNQPCPIDPELRAACTSARRFSIGMFIVSTVLLSVGATFAFVLPILLS